MKVTIAIDSLKGSLTSIEAGEAAAAGIRKVYPDAKIQVCPLADGGEGTAEALVFGMGGSWQTLMATGPLGDKVECKYGMIAEKNLAIIEMASAAGITLIKPEERNPLLTTTYGVGEMIRDAILKGCRNFIIGIGGSATNDGGIGMLQALGFEFLDKNGVQVPYGANGVAELCAICEEHVMPELKDCTFKVACDVTNPLCGEYGCSAVYGPQKGADTEMIGKMDRWLGAYAKLTRELHGVDFSEHPGAGAAGGLGFAFLSFINAKLESGIQIVLNETGLEKHIEASEIVITGEGRLDGQTVMGKAPIGVAKLAKKHGKKVIAFSGAVTRDAVKCNEAGIDAFFPIVRGASALSDAMKPENARQNMIDTAEQVFHLIKTFQN